MPEAKLVLEKPRAPRTWILGPDLETLDDHVPDGPSHLCWEPDQLRGLTIHGGDSLVLCGLDESVLRSDNREVWAVVIQQALRAQGMINISVCDHEAWMAVRRRKATERAVVGGADV